MLADLDQLTEAVGSGPTSFVHGDCHLGNILRDGSGRLLLVDWQSSGVGPSAGDLAFALTRAVPTGATIPRNQAIAAYCERAGVEVGPTDRRITAQQLLTLSAPTWRFTRRHSGPAGRTVSEAQEVPPSQHSGASPR